MNIRGRQCSQRAFTLVEVMIAIGIFAMVIAAIYACWSAVLRSSKVGTAAAEQVQRSRMAMRWMEDALMNTRMSASRSDLYYFEFESGNDFSLTFAAQLPKSYPRSSKFGDLTLRRVEFKLEPGLDSKSQLVLRQKPLLMDYDEDEEHYPVVLARDVEEIDCQAWDEDEEDWVDEWTKTNTIPIMIRLTLATAARKGNQEVKEENTVVVSPACMAIEPAFLGGARRPFQPPLNNSGGGPLNGGGQQPPPK